MKLVFHRRVKCEEGEKTDIPAMFNRYMDQQNFMGLGQPAGFGVASGFCSGYLLKKVGRVAVVSVGVVFVMFQSAAQAGYLTVNWSKIEKDFNSFVGNVDVIKEGGNEGAAVAIASKAANYFTANTGIASGAFVTGFILGIRKG